jgi:hypothetical protein
MPRCGSPIKIFSNQQVNPTNEENPMKKTKKAKVRDMKPKKDAKGGGGWPPKSPQGGGDNPDPRGHPAN